ncbi:MAG: cytochrome c biogenesis protein CcsA [Phycisphaerae bacterium]
MVTTGQIVVLVLAAVLLAAGWGLSLARVWRDGESLRLGAKALSWLGVICAAGVLVWHILSRPGNNWVPLEDNFEALVGLAVLLGAFVLYVQRARTVGPLDWFTLPVAVVLLVAAGIFGATKPQPYVDTTWSWVHRISTFGGTAAFAIAGAAGGLYLLANRRLRRKDLKAEHGPRLGSLERIERITFTAVTLGFALLTVGLVTGLVRAVRENGGRMGPGWETSPKVLLAAAVWLVYAVVLHSPINPSFRGRKVAMLSILGLVLMVGTLVAVNLMPAAGGAK